MSEENKTSEDKKPDESKNEDEKKKPFVPMEKQSKQERKKFHDAQRGTWGNVNPVTRKPPNPKAYNRAKRVPRPR